MLATETHFRNKSYLALRFPNFDVTVLEHFMEDSTGLTLIGLFGEKLPQDTEPKSPPVLNAP